MGDKKRNDPTSSNVWLVSAAKVGVHAITGNETELSGLIKFNNVESVNFSTLESEYFMPAGTTADMNFYVSSIAGIRRMPRSDPDEELAVCLIVGIKLSNGTS